MFDLSSFYFTKSKLQKSFVFQECLTFEVPFKMVNLSILTTYRNETYMIKSSSKHKEQ